MRLRFVLAGLVAVLALSGGWVLSGLAGSSEPTRQRRLADGWSRPLAASQPLTVATTKGSISALAQDGDRLVWIEAANREPGCGEEGRYQTLVTQLVSRSARQQVLKRRICNADTQVAVADEWILWSTSSEGNYLYTSVHSKLVGDRRSFTPETDLVSGGALDDPQDWLTELAGDRSLLTYAGGKSRFSCDAPETSESCRVVSSSWAKRVVGKTSRTLSGVYGGQIAVAAPNIASVSSVNERARPRVDVRNANTGARLSAFVLPTTPRVLDIALTPDYVIVLVSSLITVRDVHSGEVIRNRPVSSAVESLSASSRAIVYTDEKDIHAVDLRSFVDRRIVRSRASPVDASIEGSRVIWAERTSTGGRILAVTVS